MAKLSKTIEKVRAGWMAIPTAKRDEILRSVSTAHTAMRNATRLLPMGLIDDLVQLAKDASQAALMPFGPGLEGVLVDIAGAIPELSAYVRQMMGD